MNDFIASMTCCYCCFIGLYV